MMGHLVDLSQRASQELFADVVGITQQAVSEIFSRGILPRDATLRDWLHAYCANLREQAAGRSEELVRQRARLAMEQADRVAMENAKMRRELAPIALLETVLARVCRQIAGILESIPVQLKRRANLSTEDRDFITAEINRARDLAAAVELRLEEDEDDDGSVRDSPSDPLRAQAA